MVLGFLERSGYSGQVFPVNPRYEAIKDWKCFPSVSA
jgi:acyl-CoA synthetase (NDP forming)